MKVWVYGYYFQKDGSSALYDVSVFGTKEAALDYANRAGFTGKRIAAIGPVMAVCHATDSDRRAIIREEGVF
jgi:hypothetical protein